MWKIELTSITLKSNVVLSTIFMLKRTCGIRGRGGSRYVKIALIQDDFKIWEMEMTSIALKSNLVMPTIYMLKRTCGR